MLQPLVTVVTCPCVREPCLKAQKYLELEIL